MADYKQTDIAGSKYQRACRIMIENPIGGPPSVVFVEEEITTVTGQNPIHRLVGRLPVAYDPNEMVTMIDPTTNLPTETVYPASLAQWIIYSIYWKKAGERDVELAARPVQSNTRPTV